MKTKNLNVLSLVRMTLLGTMLIFSGVASGQAGSKKTTGKFHKDNAQINKDVNDIVCQRTSVKYLETKVKNDDKAGNEYALNMDRKNLEKAEADLKKSKTYLVADKMDFEKDYKLALKDRKKTIKQDKADLRESKRLLNKAICKKNTSAITPNAAKVALYQKKLQSDIDAYKDEKANMKADVAIINDEVKKSKEELAVVKSVESTYTSAKSEVKSWFKKSKKT